MKRLPLLLLLSAATLVIAACSQASTGPRQDDLCASGYIMSGGLCVPDTNPTAPTP